jgi:hypothetical protein
MAKIKSHIRTLKSGKKVKVKSHSRSSSLDKVATSLGYTKSRLGYYYKGPKRG